MLAPKAGVELAPKPNPGVLAGLAPKEEPKPNDDPLLAAGAAPKPPNGELLGDAPNAGVGLAPKGLGEGVPNGEAAGAGLAPNGDDAGDAPKPPKLGVDAAEGGGAARVHFQRGAAAAVCVGLRLT